VWQYPARMVLMAQAETAGLFGGNVRGVLIRIALVMLASEAAISVVLTLRFWLAYDYGFGRATGEAVFHAVQAFNNAGFALYPDSLMGFVGDWWICVPLSLGVLGGSIGFPVLFELAREWRTPGRWSTHTRLQVTSAFATVGLTTGITPALPPSAQVVLVILMYVGRVGTIAVGTAIALNTRRRNYRYPEERPLVG
jgi:Trk-type K+ transport system membrane component